MMQQYEEAKARHPGMLLLFRMGDFFETFGDDAELVSRVLGLTLTSRDKTVPMAGFPHHQLEPYLRRLLTAGHRVAVCDQVEDAALAKGLVKREVVRVVTPGTLTEDELLDPRRPNHLAALWAGKGVVGLAWVELANGTIFASDLRPERLADELGRIAPAECLAAEDDLEELAEFTAGLSRPLTARPGWTFDPVTARDALRQHFGVASLAGFGFAADTGPGLAAAGAVLHYLGETLKSNLAHLRRLRPHQPDRFLLLDEVTRRSLELTRTLRDGNRDGSLLSVIDRTVTPMGARLLHDWLVAPLTERAAIEARLDAVGELLADHALRQALRERLSGAFDLNRLTARVSTGRATPKDLAAIARTLRLLPRLKTLIAGRQAKLLADLEARLEPCAELRETLDAALVDEPPLSAKEGGVIREGYHKELDDLRAISRDGKNWILRFQADEITRTGIGSLKVGFNQVFGYYIEVTHTHTQRVPANYQRKQTLKNAERYITPELKEYEEKVLTAQEKGQQLEYDLFLSLREQAAAQTPRLLATAEGLAALDVLAALAELAAQRNYSRPELSDEPVLEVSDGRHPVLDQTLPAGTFVPNDVALGTDGRVWLITGPNMAGKSTFLRQCALLTLLAQMGSFVPAKRARVGLADRVFTRVGASDELSRGQSTFMVEMTEAANILNNATPRSLVVLDEIGRGTSTFDGVSLAWAITEHLHDSVGCRALFATHYHELAQLSQSLPQLRNYNVRVQEANETVVFLHKIGPGSADKSYGIHVARLAGVPGPVVARAAQVLAALENPHPPAPAHPPAGPANALPPERVAPRRRKLQPRIGPDLFGDAAAEPRGEREKPAS